MKKHNVLENNRLIAKFMGEDSLTEFNWVLFRNGIGVQYESNWSELMPVVEKIETSILDGDVVIKIEGDNCFITYGDTWNLYSTLDSKIESTYQAVVEFIKWYNEQTNS